MQVVPLTVGTTKNLESCLSCGQPVHPVAGRCKHCRADLVALRQAVRRSAAQAATQAAQAENARLIAASAPPPGPPPAARDVAGERPPPANAEPTLRVARPPEPPPRRWRLALAGAVLLLLSVASGIMAHRVYARVRGATKARPADATALNVPASAGATDPGGARTPPTADDPDPADPTDPADPSPQADPFGGSPFGLSPFGGRGGLGLDPFSLLDPFARRRPPRAPGTPPDVSSADRFIAQLAGSVCERLSACGLELGVDPGMCELVAESLVTPGLLDPGSCRYDAGAAGDCLAAIGGMKCDADHPEQLLALLEGVDSCTRALSCD